MPKCPLALSHLLRLDRQLRRDQNESMRHLQERDRAIGAGLEGRSAQSKLLSWLEAVAEEKPHSARAVESILPPALAALGCLFGISAMGGLLLVDQQRPVNVLVFLGLFVGLQLLLLLLTLAASLLPSLRGEMSNNSGHFNIIHWLVRRGYGRLRDELRPDQFAPLLRWRMLSLGQLFGLCFNAGALLALLSILLVMDRSFGWSSTLNLSSRSLYQLLNGLSAPWSWIWPAAGVDMSLVESTRYQSLQQHFSSGQVQAMRMWWPFLCAAIISYGLLPRLLLWIVFQWVYKRQLRLAFINYPGARLVLGRMDSPLVHTQASGHEQAEAPADTSMLRRSLPQGELTLVNWAGALSADSDVQQWRQEDHELHSAGIHLEEDAALLDQINQYGHDVMIVVKSWEPPLSELGDFLRGISPKLNCYLYLQPLAGQNIKADALTDWQHFTRQGHHPRLLLIVADAPAGAGS